MNIQFGRRSDQVERLDRIERQPAAMAGDIHGTLSGGFIIDVERIVGIVDRLVLEFDQQLVEIATLGDVADLVDVHDDDVTGTPVIGIKLGTGTIDAQFFQEREGHRRRRADKLAVRSEGVLDHKDFGADPIKFVDQLRIIKVAIPIEGRNAPIGDEHIFQVRRDRDARRIMDVQVRHPAKRKPAFIRAALLVHADDQPADGERLFEHADFLTHGQGTDLGNDMRAGWRIFQQFGAAIAIATGNEHHLVRIDRRLDIEHFDTRRHLVDDRTPAMDIGLTLDRALLFIDVDDHDQAGIAVLIVDPGALTEHFGHRQADIEAGAVGVQCHAGDMAELFTPAGDFHVQRMLRIANDLQIIIPARIDVDDIDLAQPGRVEIAILRIDRERRDNAAFDLDEIIVAVGVEVILAQRQRIDDGNALFGRDKCRTQIAGHDDFPDRRPQIDARDQFVIGLGFFERELAIDDLNAVRIADKGISRLIVDLDDRAFHQFREIIGFTARRTERADCRAHDRDIAGPQKDSGRRGEFELLYPANFTRYHRVGYDDAL